MEDFFKTLVYFLLEVHLYIQMSNQFIIQKLLKQQSQRAMERQLRLLHETGQPWFPFPDHVGVEQDVSAGSRRVRDGVENIHARPRAACVNHDVHRAH